MVRFRASDPRFTKTATGSHKMPVRLEELESLSLVEWRCEYSGETFVVNDEDSDKPYVTYAGESETRARELGMNVVERFVATGEIPKDASENLREVRKQYWPTTVQE